MNAHDPLNFLGAIGSMPMKRIAGAMPVTRSEFDLLWGDQAFDGSDIPQKLRMLPDPADLGTGEGLCDHQHVFFPLGLEAAPLLAPLQIPVPDTRENQQAEGQLAERDAAAFDDAGG